MEPRKKPDDARMALAGSTINIPIDNDDPTWVFKIGSQLDVKMKSELCWVSLGKPECVCGRIPICVEFHL